MSVHIVWNYPNPDLHCSPKVLKDPEVLTVEIKDRTRFSITMHEGIEGPPKCIEAEPISRSMLLIQGDISMHVSNQNLKALNSARYPLKSDQPKSVHDAISAVLKDSHPLSTRHIERALLRKGWRYPPNLIHQTLSDDLDFTFDGAWRLATKDEKYQPDERLVFKDLLTFKGSTTKGVARRLGMTTPQVVSALKKLRKDGWVQPIGKPAKWSACHPSESTSIPH